MPLNRDNFKRVRRAVSLAAAMALLTGLATTRTSSAQQERPRRQWVVNDLNPAVLRLALKAAQVARRQGKSDGRILGVIDFSLPSTTRRFWVLDLEHRQVLFHEFVAHGKGSGEKWAKSFSNKPKSLQSSLGLYVTLYTYTGENGYSLKLRGLEDGVNDRAESRAIVIHGAPYVSQAKIDQLGYLGRSWGCPAVSKSVSERLIDTLKDGNLLFAYYPDKDWLTTSRFLNP